MTECTCCTKKIQSNASVDPTRTLTLRRRLERQLGKRFRRIKGKINDEVVKKDGFGLRVNRGIFEFETDAEKIDAFRQWLATQIYSGILQVSPNTPPLQAAEDSWLTEYIDAAYERGLQNTASGMRAQGATISEQFIKGAFSRSIHGNTLKSLYTRTFNALEGITQEMDTQISRVLADGLARGDNPLKIAEVINNRVDKIGITRARILARTEIVRAHADAQLNMFEEVGVQDVGIIAEFLTAGDSRVCPICAALEGEKYTVKNAHGVIPVHPNCRCVFITEINNAKQINV